MPNIIFSLLKIILTKFLADKFSSTLGVGVSSAEETVKMNGAMAYILVLRSLRLILIGSFIALIILVLGITLLFVFVIAAMNLLEVSEQTKNIVYLSISGAGLIAFTFIICQLFSEKQWIKVFKVEQILASLSK